MKRILRAIAFAAALLPGIAAAQVPQYPQTLPPGTVIGRLGTIPGPSQAIPFSVLFSQFQVQAGAVTGPGASTVGDFALWGNTFGTALTDPGAPGTGVIAALLTGINTTGGLVTKVIVSGTTTVNIDPTGNDANAATYCAGTGTAACLSPSVAMSVVSNNFINNGVTIIKFADGTYTTPFIATPYIGTGTVQIVGNTTTPDNATFITGIVRNCIFCFQYAGGQWVLHGVKISSSVGSGNGNGILVQGNLGVVTIGNIDFGALPGIGSHVAGLYGGHIENDTAITISGGSAHFLSAADNSIVHVGDASQPITLTGTPAFSASLIFAHGSGAIVGTTAANYSGSATGNSFNADDGGLLDVAAPNLLPGNGLGGCGTGSLISGIVCNPVLGGPSIGVRGSVKANGAVSGSVSIQPSGDTLVSDFIALLPPINDTLVTLTATQTLTNKTINGASNTLTVRAANDITGTLPVANGGTGQTSIAGQQAALSISQFEVCSAGVSFTASNTDHAIAAPLPTGFTRLAPRFISISHASATLAAATFGVFSATGAGGVALIAAGTAVTVSATADATLNNQQIASATLTADFIGASLSPANTIQFRVGTGATGTADVCLDYWARP